MRSRVAALGFAIAGGVAALTQTSTPSHVTLAIMGDFRGQLSPCGCAKPMVGGIKRAASVISSIRQSGRPVLLVSNGALTTGDASKQQGMKAIARAESLNVLKPALVNLSADDCATGFGVISTMSSLLGSSLGGPVKIVP